MYKNEFYKLLGEYEKEDGSMLSPLIKNFIFGFVLWLIRNKALIAAPKE